MFNINNLLLDNFIHLFHIYFYLIGTYFQYIIIMLFFLKLIFAFRTIKSNILLYIN